MNVTDNVNTEFITKQEAIEAIVVYLGDDDFAQANVSEIERRINAIQPHDVEEVIRCGDCIYRTRNKDKKTRNELPYYCKIHSEKMVELSEFCNYGVKRDG